MRDLKEYDYGALLLNLSTTSLNKAQRRWRIAYTAIYSARAMLSLVKEIVPGRIKSSDASLSYTALESGGGAKINSMPLSYVPDIDQERLVEIMKGKDLPGIRALGGVEGIAASLRTNATKGIHGNEQEVNRRRDLFGSNTYQKPPPKGLLFFVYDAFKDTTILILLACATLSLGFGIKEHGLQEGWYEGGSIFVAVFLVIVVSALSNFRQERQFDKLSKISSNIKVEVLRDSRRQHISIFDVVVGDVVFLKIGDQIPADGLFLDGHSLQVDESSMTGESDHLEVDHKDNPFLFSGTKIVDGFAQMLVVSVGMSTTWGQTMSSINQDSSERTPLQVRLDTLTSTIGKLGLTVAALVLVVLLVRYFTGNTKKDGKIEYNGSKTPVDTVVSSVVRIVSVAVTIVVVAIPEGLPLAVTLTLAYSMKRMMSDQAMVRKLSAKFWLGQESIHEDSTQMISSDVLDLLYQGTGLNTTGSVCVSESGPTPEFSGSPTEKALLSWTVLNLGMDMESVKQKYDVLGVETFNSAKKRSGVLVRRKSDNTVHVHWKGAAEMVLAMCSQYYTSTGSVDLMDSTAKNRIQAIIQGMAASSLRCIAFAHKVSLNNSGLEEDGLTLMGIVGLKDPCRPGVSKAVETCKLAGVTIKMITGDNVFTAKAIAFECGILDHNDKDVEEEAVVEGVQFRNYTEEERMQKIEKIRVMARSSPSDKLLMVKCLRLKGHVVAVTGDGTNDAPALKEADIGLSMGIQGTEVAKESSDIVILDDNFTSVATVLKWGRCVYNNIQKFIQFQLTVNVAALVINFIAAVSAGEVPLTAVQLLWVNLIMDTLGALALATERPTNELLKRKPVGRTEPLITNVMWRNLLVQSLYQIAVLLILQFKGMSIFNVRKEVKDTLIFNTFVLCQVFNEFNAREMEKKNVFKGIHRNRLFIGIIAITIVLQVIMVEFLKNFADTVRLNGWQWGTCIAIASLSWPIGFFTKFIPVSETPFLSYFKNPRSLFKGSRSPSLKKP